MTPIGRRTARRRLATCVVLALLAGCQDPPVTPERVHVGADPVSAASADAPPPVEPDSVTYESLGDPASNAQEPFVGPGGKPFDPSAWQRPVVDPDRVRASGGDSSVDRGLAAIAATQRADGSWDGGSPTGDLAATAAAGLAFLGFGETHQSGAYKNVVKRFTRYLKTRQNEDGGFGTATSDDERLAHLLATAVLTEAFGMTSSRLFKASAASAGQRLIADVEAATWVPSEDPYVVLWQIQVLRSYEMAELGKTDKTLGRLLVQQDLAARSGDDWAALRVLVDELGRSPDDAAKRRAGDDYTALFGEDAKGGPDFLALTSEQRHLRLVTLCNNDAGRSETEVKLVRAVRALQIDDASDARDGSWPIASPRGERFGPTYATALALLVVESWYHYPRQTRAK